MIHLLDLLVKKLSTLLYEGDLYAIRDRDGNIVYYNQTRLEQEKIDDINPTDNKRYFTTWMW